MQRKYLSLNYRGTSLDPAPESAPTVASIHGRGRTRKSDFRTAALLYAGSWPVGLSCTVHDYSDTGARLQLDDPNPAHKMIVHIPSHVRLHLLPWQQEVDCRIVWRDGSHLGVEYVGGMRSATAGSE